MGKFICTHCGELRDNIICPVCGHETAYNQTKAGTMLPIEAERIRKPPIDVPHRPLTQNEVDVLEKLLKAAPYYILRYGVLGLEVVEKYIGTGTPVLKILFKGLKWGLSWASGKLSIK